MSEAPLGLLYVRVDLSAMFTELTFHKWGIRNPPLVKRQFCGHELRSTPT